MLRGRFKVELTIRRVIGCFDCDHCQEGRNLAVGKKRFGIFKTVHYVEWFKCSKLGISLDYEKHICLSSDSLPCDGEFWQETSDFDVLDHEETVYFKDIELLPPPKKETTIQDGT